MKSVAFLGELDLGLMEFLLALQVTSLIVFVDWNLWRWKQLKSWRKVAARVVKSDLVESKTDSGRKQYKAQIVYEYSANDKT